MSLSQSEVKKALKVSKAIQHYIELTNQTNLRSTDIFPYLVNKGLFVKDKNNGLYFRRFLKKLDRCGELNTLIPQCSRVKPIKNEIFSEWYFHNAKDKMPKSVLEKPECKLETIIPIEPKEKVKETFKKEQKLNGRLEFDEAVEIVSELIAGVNPLTNEYLDVDNVCCNEKVRLALKTIISPQSYRQEIEKLKTSINNQKSNIELDTELSDKQDEDDWLIDIKNEINTWKNKRLESKFSEIELNIRKVHKRAYEFWSEREEEILKKAWDYFKNEHKLAELLQRTPSSIKRKLKALEVIQKN